MMYRCIGHVEGELEHNKLYRVVGSRAAFFNVINKKGIEKSYWSGMFVKEEFKEGDLVYFTGDVGSKHYRVFSSIDGTMVKFSDGTRIDLKFRDLFRVEK